MKKLNLQIVDLPHERIDSVKEAYMLLSEKSLTHFLDYKSSQKDLNEDDPILSNWSEVEHNYRKCTVKKEAITNVEIRTTGVVEEEQHVLFLIAGTDFSLVTFFPLESFEIARELEQEVLNWLGW